MLKRLKTTWIVISRMILHKLQGTHRGDFWAWAYVRVTNRRCGDFENPTLVWFLLDNALRTQEHIRALAVFRDFQSLIESTWSQRYKDLVSKSLEEAEKLDLAAYRYTQ